MRPTCNHAWHGWPCLSFLLFASLAASAASSPQDDDLARPHLRVSVGDHRLNLACAGESAPGAPTVVFEAPAGTSAMTWWAVAPQVARQARACVYDRAGIGFSDAATPTPVGRAAVDDLHRLLGAAGVRPPYVLVGGSLGGALAQLYRHGYPSEVAGMVLVEPMHEDEPERLDRASGGRLKALEAAQGEALAACVAQAEKGFEKGSELAMACVGPAPATWPAGLAASDLAARTAPDYWHATRDEHAGFDTVRAQLRATRGPAIDLPLIVLARGVSPYAIPGQPPSEANRAVEAANLAMQQAVANISRQGELRVVAGADHLVQEARPDAVVTAVLDVLARVRR